MVAEWWMVVLAGAVGGLLSYMIGPRTVELDWPRPLDMLPYVLLGAAAGYIAIYVLSFADPQQAMRCIGMALTAGIAWKPVIDGGKELILSRSQRAAEAEARSKASELDRLVDDLKKKSGNASLVQEIGAKGSDLTLRLSEVRRSPARTRAVAAITRALDTVSATTTRDDAASIAAVRGIVSAAVRGDGAVLRQALGSAARLPVTQNSPLEQDLKHLQRLAQLQ